MKNFVTAGFGLMAFAGMAFAAPLNYNNGPLQTEAAGGSGGAPRSTLQTALGLNVFGFGHQVTANNRVADDFTVPAGRKWTINSIRFFGYQTGATAPSMTALNFEIRETTLTGTLKFGDTTTNRLSGVAFANLFRVTDTAPTDANRRIQVLTANISGGVVLNAGTYWINCRKAAPLPPAPGLPPSPCSARPRPRPRRLVA